MKKTSFLFLVFAFFVFAHVAQAATLSMGQKGPYQIGQSFTLPIYVSMGSGESMNAVSGTLSFPTDKLQAVSITKGSVVDFWVQNPSFSNGNGSASFEGVTYNPGYSGQGGLVLSVTFKVVGAGQARIAFSSASVLANDGQGTNILDSANGTTVTIGAAPVQPVTPEPTPTATPVPAPTVPKIKTADTTAPKAFTITFPHTSSSTDIRPLISFVTTDDTAVVEYQVSVNGGPEVAVSPKDIRNNPYQLPQQSPGPGSVKVTAYDAAGNHTSAVADFMVIGSPAPVLELVADVTSGNLLEVIGKAEPNVRVDVEVMDSRNSTSTQSVNSTGSGAFKLVWKNKLAPGAYNAQAMSINEATGARSYASEPQQFQVTASPILTYGWQALSYTSLILVFLALLAGLAFGGWYFWQEFLKFRKRVHSRSMRTSDSVHAHFAELTDVIAEEIAALQQIRTERELTMEEERFLKRFTTLLEKTEHTISKQVSSIGK